MPTDALMPVLVKKPYVRPIPTVLLC